MSDIVVSYEVQNIEIIEEIYNGSIDEVVVEAVTQIEVLDLGSSSPSSGFVSDSMEFIAGEILSANKIIYPGAGGKMFYASNDNPACKSVVWGMTRYSAAKDAVGFGVSRGIMSNNTWNWDTTKPIFLGLNGEMTQVVPTSGFLLVVARPITATSVMVRIEIPINR